MSVDGKGYILPETINPGRWKCVKVFIPDDLQYYAAFWGAYEYFTTWKAWQRTGDTKGKQAAAVWKVGFDAARLLWPDMEGCEMPFLLRDDPNDPCAVEQSLDGGTTWIHAFTKDCDDPATPIPTPSAAAAEAAGNFMFNLYINIFQELNTNPTRSAFSDWFCDYLDTIGITYTFDTCGASGTSLWDLWDEADAPTKAAWLDPCNLVPNYEELQACYDIDGVIDWVNCTTQTLLDWLGENVDPMFEELHAIWQTMTGESAQNAFDYDGGGPGADFGSPCVGTGIFGCVDFDETPGGYVKVGAYGQWLDGVGWKAQINDVDFWECTIRKVGGFPPTTPGNIRVVYTPTGNSKLCRLTVNGAVAKAQYGGAAGYRQLNWTPFEPIESIEITVHQNNLNNLLTIDEICITE